MPSFIITKTPLKIGQEIDAILADPNVVGRPDRRTDTPVRVRLVDERTVCVDDEPRGIISSVSESGSTTLLVDGSTRSVCNRERRQRLAQATALTEQLRAVVAPLTAGSEEGIAAPLQEIFDWLRKERQESERAPTTPRLNADGR